MKVEGTDGTPAFNPLNFDGTKSQPHSEVISHVLINDAWYEIIVGSFKLYKTGGDRPVPFVQFDLPSRDQNDFAQLGSNLDGKRVQVFPNAMSGVAFSVPEDDK